MLDLADNRASEFSDEGWLKSAAERARIANQMLSRSSDASRNAALNAVAANLRRREAQILAANEQDVLAFRGSLAFRDRLLLDSERVEAMARGLESVAALPDPLNRTLDSWSRPNGLQISRITVPIGVIAMIYESRPNVGVDAAGLCLKSGNSILLRGGSESYATSVAIHDAISGGLKEAGMPPAAVQMAPSASRAIVAAMLEATGQIDLLIPRGGKSLVERVQREARVPVLSHAEGICHTYIDEAADFEMALDILINAKLRRPGICSATETLLIDTAVAAQWLPRIIERLGTLGCAFRGDARACEAVSSLPRASEDDFRREWHDAVLSVAVVDGVEGAISHVNRFGSSHTDAIVTGDPAAAQRFLAEVNSAVALWNASTQFGDGGEFGFGAEIGISTGRLHARGPIGTEQLTTFRYNVIGTGQVRE